MASTEHILVLSTMPDEAVANEIAETLVDDGLAACVNILPGITSVYRWQDKIEKDRELLLYIKTTNKVYKKVEETIQRLHPYELPEIIAVPIERGLGDYLEWVSLETLVHGG